MEPKVIVSMGPFKEEPAGGNFHGTVLREQLEEGADSPEFRGAFVRFRAGAHTKLHHHTGWQLLYVTEGTGFIESSAGKRCELEPGARALIPPGELHRHGANKDGDFVHLAVTVGETHWWHADPEDSGGKEVR
jgi:quercetin dioxygenase-like cupin family protein